MQIIDPDSGETVILFPTKELSHDLQEYSDGACNHVHIELRRWIMSNGAERYQSQCLKCGAARQQSIKKADAPSETPFSDSDLAAKHEQQRKDDLEKIGLKHFAIMRAKGRKYDQYLRSSKWKRKAAMVLKSAQGVCEGCLEKTPTQVHHITYDHIFDELLFELVALCDDCHTRCHAKK